VAPGRDPLVRVQQLQRAGDICGYVAAGPLGPRDQVTLALACELEMKERMQEHVLIVHADAAHRIVEIPKCDA
jgi:hypothetical protein